MFSFSQSVTKLLGLAVLLTLGIGLACAFFVSYGLAQPVAQLSKELVDAQEQRKAVPEFSRTGIRELDQLAEAIVTLSTDNYKAAVAERSRIEHERDYDALTGLYSRQAFFRVYSPAKLRLKSQIEIPCRFHSLYGSPINENASSVIFFL